MTVDRYEVGDTVTLAFATVDGNDDPADAGNVAVTVVDPAGAVTVTDPVASTTTGNYEHAVVADSVGTWTVAWVATGDNAATESAQFYVVNPASELVTLDDLAAYLQQSFTGDLATSAQAACEQATATVRGWCRQVITRATHTESVTVRTGDAVDHVILHERPVVSVTSVTVDGVELASGWTLARQIVTLDRDAYTSVAVVYEAGREPGDALLGVARSVAVRLAARLYQNPLDRGSYTGPGDLSYAPAAGVSARLLTGDEQMMLSEVRDPVGFA